MVRYLTRCLIRMLYQTNRSLIHKPLVPSRKSSNAAALEIVPEIKSIDIVEIAKFSEFNREAQCGSTLAMTALMEILSIGKMQAKKAIDQYPSFKYLAKKTIYQNFEILRAKGVNKSTIKDNKFLFIHTTSDLREKIILVDRIGMDINESIHLFHLTVKQLENFVRAMTQDAIYLPHGNRILYLAEKLNCDVAEICRILSYRRFMFKLPALKIRFITEYVLDCGVAPEHIINDLHVYKYKIDTVKSKILRAKEQGVTPLKPWVLRCSREVWEKAEERQIQRQTLLQYHEKIEDLMSALFECDIEVVNYLFSKNPSYRGIKIEKFMDLALVLRNEGYTIEDIQRAPRIMHRKYEKMVEYLSLWKKYAPDGKRLPLCNLMLSKVKFMKLLSDYSKNVQATL